MLSLAALGLSPIASKLVKYGFISLLVLGTVFAIFYTGLKYERRKWELREAKEVIRRTNETRKVVERHTETKRKVEDARRTSPVDDGRDTCLLSSTRPSEDCLR